MFPTRTWINVAATGWRVAARSPIKPDRTGAVARRTASQYY
jgi:hypothetical protein